MTPLRFLTVETSDMVRRTAGESIEGDEIHTWSSTGRGINTKTRKGRERTRRRGQFLIYPDPKCRWILSDLVRFSHYHNLS